MIAPGSGDRGDPLSEGQGCRTDEHRSGPLKACQTRRGGPGQPRPKGLAQPVDFAADCRVVSVAVPVANNDGPCFGSIAGHKKAQGYTNYFSLFISENEVT
jgi:hypothetical protein